MPCTQGVEVYVAPTWDQGDAWISSMKHIAKEGACWVIGSGSAIKASDIPKSFPGREAFILTLMNGLILATLWSLPLEAL
jgi:hypothetical protein